MPNEIDEYSEFDLDYTGEPAETEGQILEPTEPQPQEETPAEPQPNESVQEPSVPVEPQTAEPSAEDDITSLRQQLAEAQMELLKYRNAPAQPTPATAPAVAPQPQAPTQPQNPLQFEIPKTANEVTNLDFIGQEDHISILEDRAKLNSLLNKVATVAFNAAVTASQERILRQIPSVVETTASQQLRISEIVSNFYNSNKDLEPYKPAVSMAAMKLHNENPNMPLEEMLTKAAEETRKVLRIRPTNSQRLRMPAQPVGSGKVGGDRLARPANLSEQEQQILDLLS